MSMRRIGLVLLVVAACTANTACTHVYKVDGVAYDGYRDIEKRNLDVELRLTDEFSNYTWEMKRMGDTFQMPLGQALCRNAEALCEALFDDVTVRRVTATEPSGLSAADGALTPAVSVVERAMGGWAFGKMTTVIGVEWTMTDRDGNLVWVQTIQGSGAANTGNMFTHHGNARKQAERAIEDLFTKTYEAIAASPDINAMEARR